MKSDTERKRYYTEKLHRKKSRLHVHLSKELRTQLRVKKRAILARTGDTVRVMRGPQKGKEAKISKVDVVKRKMFLEGVAVQNARGKEMPLALQPSNLMLIGLESTKERKEIFSDEAFRKKEIAKPKAEAPKTATTPKEGESAKAGEAPKPTTTPQASAATKAGESSKSNETRGAVSGGEAKADAKRNVQANMPHTTQKIR
ncbi:50S ribosomal protein L24 [Candidatus Micrarchaeota archaeon]|nr:50S ribosomal protein L24 [Candidatus Micrarchaeota archaeon]